MDAVDAEMTDGTRAESVTRRPRDAAIGNRAATQRYTESAERQTRLLCRSVAARNCSAEGGIAVSSQLSVISKPTLQLTAES
jgi:hypothetical protein